MKGVLKLTLNPRRIALAGMSLLFLLGAYLFASDIREARRSLTWSRAPGTIVRSEIGLA